MELTPDLMEDIAQHLIEENWDKFGRLLLVPPNTRRAIQAMDSDYPQKVVALLHAWIQREGKKATVQVCRSMLK